jgi:hypothetical protein
MRTICFTLVLLLRVAAAGAAQDSTTTGASKAAAPQTLAPAGVGGEPHILTRGLDLVRRLEGGAETPWDRHVGGAGRWLVGRPLGVLTAVSLSRALGLRFPSQVGWRELSVVAFIASIGFAFGLFLAAVFPVGPTLMELKMGALLTVAGSLVAIAAAWLLVTGRFRSRRAV